MKTFNCDSCGSLVFFENVQCVRCGRTLGFLPEARDLSALEPAEDGRWRALAGHAHDRIFRQCPNGLAHQVCNWLVPEEDPSAFCVSCRLNKTIPDLTVPGNRDRWRKMEQAKRRLIYTLLQLGLPLVGPPGENRPALQFEFLADPLGGPPVMTGHAGGLITLNIAEADDAERERRRVYFGEPYRTLLGHFRHEIAHYYWELFIANTPRLKCFRELFGDETRDYAASVKAYHEQGPPPDWQDRMVSAYASAHPWEDWAETWAHYLHIRDTMETAASFGITLKPEHPDAESMTANPKIVAGTEGSFDQLLRNWLPLTSALNSLNRSMGLPDLYPFILSGTAIAKLKFVHDLIQSIPKDPTPLEPKPPAG